MGWCPLNLVDPASPPLCNLFLCVISAYGDSIPFLPPGTAWWHWKQSIFEGPCHISELKSWNLSIATHCAQRCDVLVGYGLHHMRHPYPGKRCYGSAPPGGFISEGPAERCLRTHGSHCCSSRGGHQRVIVCTYYLFSQHVPCPCSYLGSQSLLSSFYS